MRMDQRGRTDRATCDTHGQDRLGRDRDEGEDKGEGRGTQEVKLEPAWHKGESDQSSGNRYTKLCQIYSARVQYMGEARITLMPQEQAEDEQ